MRFLASVVSVAVLVGLSVASLEAADAPTIGVTPGVGPPSIPGARAADYVGQQVTIEGRVAAVHESQLATVLAFAPNFAGFTATVLAADRDKFPRDLVTRLRDALVRVNGVVTAYRGKPEMTLRDPTQLVVVPQTGLARSDAAAPAAIATADGALEEIRRALLRIDDRLSTLEGRLSALEQDEAATGEPTQARASTLAVGVGTSEVRAALGDPLQVVPGPSGQASWSYGRGRSVTFDALGRVTAWTGF